MSLPLSSLYLPIALFALIGVRRGRRPLGRRLLQAADHHTYFSGDWRKARRLVRLTKLLHVRAMSQAADLVDATALRDLGDPEAAMVRLGAWVSGEVPFPMANPAIDILISAGRYQEALSIEPTGLEHLVPSLGESVLSIPALIEINRAEAEYNLGKWAEAEARLLAPAAQYDSAPTAHSFWLLQMAWVLAHQGRGEEALELCRTARLDDLPPVYQAEFYFSRAAAHLAVHRLDDAARDAKSGMDIAKRPSSARNALFLLARVEAERGNLKQAASYARRAAEHAWRWQGGDGLLRFGDVLQRLGQLDEAREAWRLAMARDPQSESAQEASRRLAEQPAL